MSSPPDIVLSTSDANATRRHKSHSHTPPPSIHELESAFESWIAWPATRCSSLQPTEDSETTIPDAYHDGSALDNTSSVTLHDKFPWHEVGVNEYTEKIPSTIVPALLQGVSDISPPRSLLDSAGDAALDGLREVDENSDLDDLPRYSAAQKGKWRARAEDDVGDGNDRVGTESLQFDSLGIENVSSFVMFSICGTGSTSQPRSPLRIGLRTVDRFYRNTRIARRRCHWAEDSRFQYVYRGNLYTPRLTKVPQIDEPSRSILAALHLLVNRDKPGCTDRSRKLGPQLIENFLDIERWAKEYFRSRHATQVIDSDVPTVCFDATCLRIMDTHISLFSC